MIRLENVTKKIKGKTVLENISLDLKEGFVYGLRGINGSGKTMLMRLIAGLIYPDCGSVSIINGSAASLCSAAGRSRPSKERFALGGSYGKRLGRELSFPERMGLLIENPVFLDSYTGFQNLALLAELTGEADAEKISRTLSRVGLDPQDKRKYRKYSLGMKQRLGIASAVMEDPALLILDEPLNALDDQGVALFEKILEEQKEKGALILLTCHDSAWLERHTDQIFQIENGRIVSRIEKEAAIYEKKER